MESSLVKVVNNVGQAELVLTEYPVHVLKVSGFVAEEKYFVQGLESVVVKKELAEAGYFLEGYGLYACKSDLHADLAGHEN